MNALKYMVILAIYGVGLAAIIFGDQDIAAFLLTWAGWTVLTVMVVAVMDREDRDASHSTDS